MNSCKGNAHDGKVEGRRRIDAKNRSHWVLCNGSFFSFCFLAEINADVLVHRGDCCWPGWPIGGGLPNDACCAASPAYIWYWTTFMGDMLFTSCQAGNPIAAGVPAYVTATGVPWRPVGGGLCGLTWLPGKGCTGLAISELITGGGCWNWPGLGYGAAPMSGGGG